MKKIVLLLVAIFALAFGADVYLAKQREFDPAKLLPYREAIQCVAGGPEGVGDYCDWASVRLDLFVVNNTGGVITASATDSRGDRVHPFQDRVRILGVSRGLTADKIRVSGVIRLDGREVWMDAVEAAPLELSEDDLAARSRREVQDQKNAELAAERAEQQRQDEEYEKRRAYMASPEGRRAALDEWDNAIRQSNVSLRKEMEGKAVRRWRTSGAGSVVVEAFEMRDGSIVYCKTTIGDVGPAIFSCDL